MPITIQNSHEYIHTRTHMVIEERILFYILLDFCNT